MGIVSTTTFSSDTETVTRAKLNGLVANLLTEFNGSIDNNNIKSGAAIAYSKLNLTSGIVNADISGSAAISASKLDLSSIAQAMQMSSKRFGMAQGANIASATTLTLGSDGNVFHVTGTTTITSITALASPALIILIFDGVLTFTDGNNLKLAGNLSTTADDTIVLWHDATNFYELCRSVN